MLGLTFELAAIVLLIVINGFFSMAEMALVSARRPRLKRLAREGRSGAATALLLLRDPDRLFSAVQIGITLIGVLTGVFGGATIAKVLGERLRDFPALTPYADVLAMTLVVVAITCATLLFGELLPKRLAFAHPERLACLAAPVMRRVIGLAKPAVLLLSRTAGILAVLLRIPGARDGDVTMDDIQGVLREGVKSGIVEHGEHELTTRIFRLGDITVSAIMTHRSKLVWLDLEDHPQVNLDRLREHHYPRFPVASGDLNNTVGVLRAKDFLLAHAATGTTDFAAFAAQPRYVLETTKALRLLELFQTGALPSYALVVDEYGDIQGVVTLSDVLRAIVGEMPAPGESPEPAIVRRDDDSWLIDGATAIDEVCEAINLCGQSAALARQYHTLAGLLLHLADRLPAIGDGFDFGGFRFEIVDMDGRRIDRVLVSKAAESGIAAR